MSASVVIGGPGSVKLIAGLILQLGKNTFPCTFDSTTCDAAGAGKEVCLCAEVFVNARHKHYYLSSYPYPQPTSGSALWVLHSTVRLQAVFSSFGKSSSLALGSGKYSHVGAHVSAEL